MLRLFARTSVILALALAPAAVSAQTAAGPRPPQPAQAPQPAQTPQPAQAPRPAQPPQTPRAERPQPEFRLPGRPVNVRIEITITDEQTGRPPVQKTVALVLADGTDGLVRSDTSALNLGNVPLRVDATVHVVDMDHVLAQIALDYLQGGTSPQGEPKATIRDSEVRQQVRTIFQSGKPIVVSESADPITDRKVKVEVKATILK
jgi:hypothetical protein